MPGTGPAVGVGPLEITPRSVIGVNEKAPAESPGSGVPSANVVIELFAGVVSALLVRRSSLWKQRTPVAFPARYCSITGHPGAANTGDIHGTSKISANE